MENGWVWQGRNDTLVELPVSSRGYRKQSCRGPSPYDDPVSSANQVLFVGVPTGGSTLGLLAPAKSAPPLGALALSSIVGTNQQTLFLVVKMMFGTPNGDRVLHFSTLVHGRAHGPI